MRPLQTFTVVPSLPPALEPLRELADNLRWTWDPDAIALFRRIDSDLWETTAHNPVLLLGTIDQDRLDALTHDEGFLAHLHRVRRAAETYQTEKSTWFRRAHRDASDLRVAYFSAEFGLTDCLSIFAGGLGILAGDHLKSASDLGLPLIGVGLLYQQGSSHQYLNDAGWQQEASVENDFANLLLTLERRPDGTPITVEIAYPGRTIVAQVWRARVGRATLYLLDTNVLGNAPADRGITDQLYGGDLVTRIDQEILLGIGGYRALRQLGLAPTVYHLNEGHAAFLTLERVRDLIRTHGLSFAEAREAASAGLVFTTHTPVPAGHDYFAPDLIERYFAAYRAELGLSRTEFLALGRQNPADENEAFCMTVLALRLATASNAVSALHEQVTRRMWRGMWPGVPEEEIPIGHVTNGVHVPSWVSAEMAELYERYLGPRWREEPADATAWREVERIPAEELWHCHELRRERLVATARRLARRQLGRRNAPAAEVEVADEILRSDALTIGFGRRFATYKRATLLLRDPERLARLLNDPARPVQVIFAGKAHPRDDGGKELIRQVVALSRQEPFRRRLVFLEDYDLALARAMVQGADVWLNVPRRPLEASGTSGMKAAANGAVNLSALDGWWDEAWKERAVGAVPIGWAVGRGEEYAGSDEQDAVEAAALYHLLEEDVIPTFYDRGPDRLPRRWIDRMKASIGALSPIYNTHRRVREYVERFYLPSAERFRALTADDLARTRTLAAWRSRVQDGWAEVRVAAVEADGTVELRVGSVVRACAVVHLGGLEPSDVAVELYLGRVNAKGAIVDAGVTPMALDGTLANGTHRFIGEATPCRRSGLQGYTVRIRPSHPNLATSHLPGLITWAPEVGQPFSQDVPATR